MAETTSGFSLPCAAVANAACNRIEAIAARNSRLRPANHALFTARYVKCASLAMKATRGRVVLLKNFVQNAERADRVSRSFGSACASSRRFRERCNFPEMSDSEIVGHFDLIGFERIHRFHKTRSRIAFKPSRGTPGILIRYGNQPMFHGIMVNVIQSRQP